MVHAHTSTLARALSCTQVTDLLATLATYSVLTSRVTTVVTKRPGLPPMAGFNAAQNMPAKRVPYPLSNSKTSWLTPSSQTAPILMVPFFTMVILASSSRPRSKPSHTTSLSLAVRMAKRTAMPIASGMVGDLPTSAHGDSAATPTFATTMALSGRGWLQMIPSSFKSS